MPSPKSEETSASPNQARFVFMEAKSLKSGSRNSYINLRCDLPSVVQQKKGSTFTKSLGAQFTAPASTAVEEEEQEVQKTATNDERGSADDDIDLIDTNEQGDGDGQSTARDLALHGDAVGEKLKNELSKYKQELREYNETTRDLEKKYMKINSELSEMQQKHDQFVGRRSISPGPEELAEEKTSLCYTASTMSFDSSSTLLRNHATPVYPSKTSFMTVLDAQETKKSVVPSGKMRHQLGGQVDADRGSGGHDHRIVDTLNKRYDTRRTHNLREQENQPYHVLRDVMNTKSHNRSDHSRDRRYSYERESVAEFSQLHTTIKDLKNEQLQCRDIIREQQERITDYHTRCVKAQEIMKTQKYEIEKLHMNNKQLETSIYQDIDMLRTKIDSKLKTVAKFPQMVREEQSKCEKVKRENSQLKEKLYRLREEADQLRTKIDELGQRKQNVLNRLKAAERDLKIFKNYNASLKSEKRRMSDELSSMKQQLDALHVASKRNLTRHREQTDKQRRELQKRIIDLETKLSRSQQSTSNLIQERDSLIAELQSQLHTLVHNFEISQNHIRVLRRHIYSMTAGRSGGGIPTVSVSEPGSMLVQQVAGPPSCTSPRGNSLRTLRTTRSGNC